jgi:F-type H+-transporting ATPase subunit b
MKTKLRLEIAIVSGSLILTSFVSPLAAAAGGEHEGWGWIETMGRWFNLLVLFGLIYYFVREPISRFFKGRREQIQNEIREAREAREQAEQKLAAVEQRMRNLDQELEELRLKAEAEAEKEKERIAVQAEEDAAKIVAASEREIEGLTRAAMQELQEYAAQLSVNLATKRIASEMDEARQERVIDRFFVKLTAGKGKS